VENRVQVALVLPDLAGQLYHQLQLGQLLGFTEVVAFMGAGESALRTQAQLVERDVLGGFFDAFTHRLLALQHRRFRTHHPQHYALALRHKPQRAEITGTGVVILKEEGIHPALVEHDVGHRLVAAFGRPGTAMVAAAQVNADCHIGRAQLYAVGNQFGVQGRQCIRIFALRFHAFAAGRITQVGEVGVVQLHVAATECIQSGRHYRLQEAEIIGGNTLRALQFIDHGEYRRYQRYILVATTELDFVLGQFGFDTTDLFEKVDMEKRTALFTVTDGAEGGDSISLKETPFFIALLLLFFCFPYADGRNTRVIWREPVAVPQSLSIIKQ